MKALITITELQERMKHFRAKMDASNPGWEIAVIFSKLNIYYFTGTMQDGMLIIPRENEAVFWVRRSIDRAVDESLFPQIKPMKSFKDAKATFATLPDTVYLETDFVPLGLYQRFNKYFPFKAVKPLDAQISSIRSVKSKYELDLMEKSGEIHKRVLEDRIPKILDEGMSEAYLATKIFEILIEEGHHGVVRFGMFDTEIGLGHVCFGESSIYPSNFNGASGNYGISAAVPVIGSRENKLKNGDLVYIDVGCGVDGYHTDKTMTYMFGKPLPDEVIEEHYKCVDLHDKIAGMLKTSAIPSEIYNTVINDLDPEFIKSFMGFEKRTVKFLGHGIGLIVDELPVIAEGFNEPLQDGMVFAIEPKKGIKGIGMVGIENTFFVTPQGGKSITGENKGLIKVY